jgi:hypothetical protein
LGFICIVELSQVALKYPALNNPRLIAYGLPEIVDALPELFVQRLNQNDRVSLGVIDTGLGVSESKWHLWRNLDEIPDNQIDDDGNTHVDDIAGWSFKTKSPYFEEISGAGHAKMCAQRLTMGCPELISVMNGEIMLSHFTMLDGLTYLFENGCKAASVSLASTSGTMMSRLMDLAIEKDAIWLTHGRGYPAYYGDDPRYDSCLIVSAAMLEDGTPRGEHDPLDCDIMVYAGSLSEAAPQPGSVIAMLRTLDPDISSLEVCHAIYAGAQHNEFTEGRCVHGLMNWKRTIEAHFGHSLTAQMIVVPEIIGGETPRWPIPEYVPPPVPPAAVVSIDEVADTTIDLSWTCPETVDEFAVRWYAAADTSPFPEAEVFLGDVFSHQITDLIPGTEYLVRVETSWKAHGTVKYSDWVAVTTLTDGVTKRFYLCRSSIASCKWN